jgi:hypothetical protein
MSMNFSVSPCLSGKFGFSDHARSRPFLQPSACVPQPRPPPPISPLLKIKAKVQFDRAVTDRSKALFFRFSGLLFQLNFSLVFPFLLFGRQRVATGRGWFFLAKLPVCQLLTACFQRSSNYCLSSLEGKHLIYHLFAPPVKYKNFLVVGSVWYFRTFHYVVIPKGVSEPRVRISGRVALRDLAF